MFTTFIKVPVDRTPVPELDPEDFPDLNPGLIRIFNQFVKETQPDGMLPPGNYFVSRTKYPFKQAVYEVAHQPPSYISQDVEVLQSNIEGEV